MRKSFTRFLSFFILFSIISLFAVAVAPIIPVGGYGPGNPGINVTHNGGAKTVTLTMTFSQAVQQGLNGTGIIALSTNAGVQLDPIQINGNVSTYVSKSAVTGSTATISGTLVTLVFQYGVDPLYPGRPVLTEGTTYQVTATGDALRNAASEYWGGITFGGWPITIADETNPFVLLVPALTGVPQFTPKDNSIAAPLASVLTVEFSEGIQFGTGNIGLYTAAGDVVEIFELATDAGDFNAAPAAGKVSIDLNNSLGLGGKILYINPSIPLVELQKYYVRIAPTAILDLSTDTGVNSNNGYVGINDNSTWNFWAADVTKPTAALTVGSPSTLTDVQKFEKPILTFSDNMTGGLFPEALVLKTAAGAAIPTTANGVFGSFAMTQDLDGAGPGAPAPYATFTATYKGNNVIEFATTVATGWTSGAVYVISYTGSAAQFADNQGNGNLGTTTYTFTAGDLLPPAFAGTAAVPATSSAALLNSTQLLLSTTMSDVSGLPVVVKYLIAPAGTAKTVADVVAGGTVLARKDLGGGVLSTTQHEALSSGPALSSNTLYDVHFIATDNATVPNTSSALTTFAGVRTNDTEAPTAVVTTVDEASAALTISSAVSALNVKENGVITITFNEKIVDLGTGVVVEYNTTGSTWVALTNGPDYTYALNGPGTIITITPLHRGVFGNGWKSSSNYRVKISASQIHDDLTGKTGSVNYIGAATYSFTTEDFEGPIPTFTSSGNSAAALQGRTNVAKADNLVVTFSEAPRDAAGVLLTNANIKNYIQVRKGDGSAVNVGSTDLNPDVAMSISGNVVTIDPNADFNSEIFYGVWVSTIITDDEGTKLNLYQDNATSITVPATKEFATFKAIDSASPLITFNTRDNANAAFTTLVDVPVDAMPYIFLSEQVKTTYGGGVAILDNNQIRSLIQLRKDNASGELINFNVVDVDASPNAAPGVAYGVSNTGTVIVIDPIDFPSTYSYNSAATYYVSIAGLQDGVGNPVSGSTTFTVVNTASLVTQSVVPAASDVQVNLAGNVVVTFDRNVAKVGGKNLYLDLNGIAPYDITVDVAGSSVVGNVVSIPYAGLTANSSYHAIIEAGAFTALNNGKPSAAVDNTFTSKDSQGPRVDLTIGSASRPTPNASAITAPITGAKLSFTFDERVEIGNGIINIKKAEVGIATTVATINMLSGTDFIVLHPGGVLTKVDINIPGLLEYSTKYIVEVPATAFTDVQLNKWEWQDLATPAPSAADDTYGNRDVVATAFGGPYVLGTSVWDFQTVSDAVPTWDLANCVPAAGAHTVSLTTGLTLAFSEPMVVNTGVHNLSIQDGIDAATKQVIDLSTVPLTWNDAHTQATITNSLVLDLLANKNYYINVDAGSFKDYSNVPNLSPALVSSSNGTNPPVAPTNWYFQTFDNTKPVISSVAYSPTDDGTQVDQDANIVITFSEAVSPVTNWATSVTFAPAIAGLLNSHYSYDAVNMTLTINPPANLPAATAYTITLVAAQTKDGSTNTNLVDATHTFTTEDIAAPLVFVNAAVQPYSTTKIKANIQVTDFTQPAGASNDIKVYYLVVADGATAPTAAAVKAGPSFDTESGVTKNLEVTGLTEKTKYDMYFVAIDKSKNANESAVTIVNEAGQKLATTDGTAPSIALLTPLNNAPSVPYGAGVAFKIKWTEQIVLSGNGSQVYIRKKSDNTLVTTIAQGAMAVVNSAVGFTSDQVNFSVGVAFLSDVTDYYVEMDNGLVKDVYNTSIGAGPADNFNTEVFIGNSNWGFKTADEVTPKLILTLAPARLTPADNATGIAVEASNSMVMVFDEDIQKNVASASWIKIYRAGTAAPFEIIPVSGADVIVGADKRTVTINRHNVFSSEASYYVVIDANAFYDYATPANLYAGMAIQAPPTFPAIVATPNDVTTGNVAGELWNFGTKDITAPVVKFFYDNGTTSFSSTPVDPTVDINTGVIIKFLDIIPVPNVFEPLFKDGVAAPADVSSYVEVTKTGGVIVASTSAYVGGAIPTITVTPTTAFTSNETYTVTLKGLTGAGALEDDATNEVGTASVTFNTDDRLSPTLTITATSTNPTTPVQVKLGTKFLVEFNKPIVNSGGGTDNIAPSKAELEAIGAYFTFKTSPGGVNVGYTVNVVPGVAGKAYEIVPTSLTSEQSYQIIWVATSGAGGVPITRVKDIVFVPGGNVLSTTTAVNTFNFTAEDGVNPLMVALTPVTTVPPAPLTIIDRLAKLTISFDEKVIGNNAAGKIVIRYSNGQIFEEINPEDCNFTDVTGPNYDVVISPTKVGGFDAQRDYYVEIPVGAFTDDSFNKMPYAGFLGNTTWKFKTDDGENPIVKTYSPVNDALGIAVNSNLVLTFSENIQIGTAGHNLAIYFTDGLTDDGNAKEIIDVTDATKVVVSGSNPADPSKTSDVVTINPTIAFDYNFPGQYYIRIDQGFVKDFTATPREYAGIHDNVTWKFNIADPSAPSLVLGYNPLNTDTNVAKTLTAVAMEFDRDIAPGAGSVKLYQYNYTTTPFSETTKLVSWADVSSLAINHTTKTVTFDFNAIDPLTNTPIPNTPLVLDDNSVYYILADNGLLKNTTLPSAQATWWIGISDPFKWRFKTTDNTAPTVVASPATGNAMLNTFGVTLTFNGTDGSIGGGSVTDVDATSVTVTGGTMVLSTETAGTVYKATITALDLADVVLHVSSAVKDVNGNALVAVNIPYKVADNNAPTLVADPNGGAMPTNVFTVTLTFNEAVEGVDSTTVKVDVGAVDVTSISSTVYEAKITALSSSVVTLAVDTLITDLAGNKFAGTTKVYNVSGDALVPTVVELTPADGAGVIPAEGIIAKPDFKIKFSEPVVVGTSGTLRIYKQEVSSVNTLVGLPLSIDATMISSDGLTLTVPSVTALEDNSDYNVIVDAGIVKSLFGVNFGGISLPTDWNFRTGDNKAPELTVIPGVQVNTKNDILATLVFTEPVYGLAGAVAVTVNGAAVEPAITGVDGDNVYKVAIHAADLADVSLTVNTTVADKYLRNHLALSQTFIYKVGDNTANPVVVTHEVNANTVTVTLTFDESVYGVDAAITATDGTITNRPIGVDGDKVYTVILNAVDGASVSVMMDNSVEDANHNTFEGGTYGPYKVGDNTVPFILSVTPEDGSINLEKNFTVEVTFSETVTVPEGSISVIANVGASSTQTHEGNVWTINVTGVADNSTVTVNLSDAIVDGADLALAAQTLTYKTGDNTQPTVGSVGPVPADKTPTNFNVTLIFSEKVTGVEGALEGSEGKVGLATTEDGMVYTVAFAGVDGAPLKLLLDKSYVFDVSGNPLTQGLDLNYTVGDHINPSVTAAPSTGENLTKNFSVKLTFSADAVVTNSDVTVSINGASSSQPVSHVANVYTVNVTAPDNSIIVITAAGTIVDTSGNSIIGTRIFTYNTGDNTAPAIITVNPNGGATENAHPANFEIFVNELVVKGTGKLTVYKKAGDVKTMELIISTVTIVPSTGSAYKVSIPLKDPGLDKFTEYYVLLSEGFVVDASGNKLDGIGSKTYWTFTTGDFVDPVVNLNDASLFKVYPNPFVEYVNVDNASKLSKIVVSNIVGQTVKEVVNPTNRIQLNELRSGVYFISLYNMDNVIAKTAKIVKR